MFEFIKKIFRKSEEREIEGIRPVLPLGQRVGDVEKIPTSPFSAQQLRELSRTSDVLSTIINALHVEMFRSGIGVESRFVRKCINCHAKFKVEVEKCSYCGGEVIPPNITERKILEDLLDEFWSVNKNGEDLIDILRGIEDDMNVFDDAYLFCKKVYKVSDEGEIISEKVDEWVRISPEIMKIIANNAGEPGKDDEGKSLKFCVQHRGQLQKDRDTCPICGVVLKSAYFSSSDARLNKIYYSGDEVCHVSKYRPSLTYGFSPINACWMKVVSLLYQDAFIKDYYMRGRPPKGLLFVNTANPDSFEKAWQKMLDMFFNNPHIIPPLAIDNPSGKKIAEFIDFMHNLKDMEFIQARDEFRRTIGAVYGVMPLFVGETQKGGMNNEGLQVVVTTRAIQMGQQIYNSKIFPFICQNLGIKDWSLKLNPVEFRDEMVKYEIEALKLKNALMYMQLGFDVELAENGDIKVTQNKKESKEEKVIPSGLGFPAGVYDPKIGIQRFVGEPAHLHGYGVFSGAPIDVRRSLGDGEFLEKEEEEMFNKSIADVYEVRKQKYPFVYTTPEILKRMKERIWKHRFEGIDWHKSKQIQKTVLDAIKTGMDAYTLKEKIKEIVPDISDFQAETIARTEGTALLNAMDEAIYKIDDPEEDKFLYKWVGVNDDRTTECCKEIEARVGDGVPLKEMRKIVEETSKKYFPNLKYREWCPHPNCRRALTRA